MAGGQSKRKPTPRESQKRPIAELFEGRLRAGGKPFLRPGDLDWRSRPAPGDSVNDKAARVRHAVKIVTGAYQRCDFELWGDLEGKPGKLVRIDDVVLPVMRQWPHLDLSPYDGGTFRYWQGSPMLRGAISIRWHRLHYFVPPVTVAQLVAVIAEHPGISEPKQREYAEQRYGHFTDTVWWEARRQSAAEPAKTGVGRPPKRSRE
jgi:hypothetical protein